MDGIGGDERRMFSIDSCIGRHSSISMKRVIRLVNSELTALSKSGPGYRELSHRCWMMARVRDSRSFIDVWLKGSNRVRSTLAKCLIADRRRSVG